MSKITYGVVNYAVLVQTVPKTERPQFVENNFIELMKILGLSPCLKGPYNSCRDVSLKTSTVWLLLPFCIVIIDY